ncbi:MAG: hypothetical protein P9L91_05055 [Candidatus Zophobacter franzmannii]|nr:hypothetical protein [Candidatus Zophobacter franzmannii]
MFLDWENNDYNLNIAEYLSESEGEYIIETVEDLTTLLAFGQRDDLVFSLQNDISLIDNPELFIPYMKGDFKGNGYTIPDLSVTSYHQSAVGLFGYVIDANINNLKVHDANIVAQFLVGILIGRSDNVTIINCSTNGCIAESVNNTSRLVGGETRILLYNVRGEEVFTEETNLSIG